MSKEQKDYIYILKEIFNCPNENSLEIYPIIKNSDNFQKFKIYMKDKNVINSNKVLLLKKLKNLFDNNDILIPFFVNNFYKKSSYFFYPIINLYLSDDIDEENMKFLDEFLFLINSYIPLNKSIFEFIYQKLSKYFGNRSKIKINEAKLLRYLRLLKIFYKDTTKSENIQIEENNNNNNQIIEEREKQIKIKNYIYFNGINSGLTFKENTEPNNGFIIFPSLEKGISFAFWIKINEQILNNYYKIYQDISINLIVIIIGENKIKLELKQNKFLILIINDVESNNVDISSNYKKDDWNIFCFVFNPQEKNSNKIFINNTSYLFNISIPNDFPFKQKIDSIICFENFIGKITSLLFFSFSLDEKIVNQLSSQLDYLSHGFYKNRILFRFLHSHDEKYFKNAINYKYRDEYKDEKLSEIYLKFELKDKNRYNIINLFCPFAYDKETNQLDDIFGNYFGNLSKNDGANFFSNYTKDIVQIVGINNLLPIAELMYSSIRGTPNPSYTQVNKDLLSESTLFEYLSIIKIILFQHSQNINYANSNNYFPNLSLFLEKYPSNVFTKKILDILVEIGIEIFKNDPDNTKPNNDHYINCILLNEKIFSKFDEENQNKLWQKILQFFTSDYTRLEYYLNISKICLLLRFYDRKRYEQYCCSYHANLFNKSKNKNKGIKNNIQIMKPEMGDKVEEFFKIIQIYVDKLIKCNKNVNNNKIEGTDINIEKKMNLYQLLTLDLSPCLQKKIIQVYIDHFLLNEQKVPKEDKISTLYNLLENDFIEISEYVLSVSLLDVRNILWSLITIIINNYLSIFMSFIKMKNINNLNRIKNIIFFLGENLFPDNLLIKIDSNKSRDDNNINERSISSKKIYFYNNINNKRVSSLEKKNKKLEQKIELIFDKNLATKNLIKYFNKDIYKEDVTYIDSYLSKWIEQLLFDKKDINTFIIDLLIIFSKKLSVGYIEKLSSYLLSIFQEYIKKNNESPNMNLKDSKEYKKSQKKANSTKDKKNNQNAIINNYLNLFENENIYHWLIDTIFYFHNEENNMNLSEEKKNTFSKIQSNTLELFKIFFSSKFNKKELKTKIKYLFDYLYYMKNYYLDKKEKLEKLSKTIRKLLDAIFECSDENININTITCFEFMFLFKNSEKLFKLNIKNNKDLIKAIFNNPIEGKYRPNEQEKNEKNLIEEKAFEIKEDNINNKNKVIINDEYIDNINIMNGNDSKKELEEKVISKTENKALNPNDFIPDYIFQGLYLSEGLLINDTKSTLNDLNIKKDSKVRDIWKDFLLCNYILDNYQSQIWGMEHICDIIKLTYKSKWEEIVNSLLEKYGNKNHKKNQNILLKEIMKIFNWTPDITEENNLEKNYQKIKSKEIKQVNPQNDIKNDLVKQNQNSINILNINLILLSIKIVLSKDDEEIDFYINQYQQFLIFCILASINLHSSVKNYEQIQNILYNILGYGFSFIKACKEDKYDELIKYIIHPIIKEINDDYNKVKFKSLFGIQKKLLYRNSAVFKLFMSVIPEEKDKTKEKDINIKKEEDIKDNNKEIKDKINSPILKNNSKEKVYLDFHCNINKIINEIFNNTLEEYRKYREANSIENIINFYEKTGSEIIKAPMIFEEKRFVQEKIKELIPFVESQIKENYSYTYYIQKKRRNNYKKIKNKVFSWKGFWSDRNIFFNHPEYLKVKIKNHFTKEMYKALLSPVLDVNYYIPNFNAFDKKNLFNSNNYKYFINMNVDEILEGNSNQFYDKNIRAKSLNIVQNNNGFNYLESLYKYNYEGIWNLYNKRKNVSFSLLGKKEIDIITNYIVDDINNKRNITKDENTNNNELSENNTNQKNINNSNEIKNFCCCLVKPSHHIKGFIIAKNKYIIFIPEDNRYKTEEIIRKENENNPKFDKVSGCCYGSYFKLFLKDKDMLHLFIEYSKIKYIFIRVYFYYESALEIYTIDYKSYYLNFKTKEDMNKFLNIILSNNPQFLEIKTENKRILGYALKNKMKEKKKSYYIINTQEEWQNYNKSTLEYLMWLNIYGGRSYNDITQYPVFPWILMNYQINDISNAENLERDFSLPMGMITLDYWKQSEKRKNEYLEVYQNIKNLFEDNNPKFNFDTYLEKGEEYYYSYNNKRLKMKMKQEKKNNGNKGGEDDYYDCENEYEVIQINQLPFIFGSHYSNPLYTAHYLVRMFPFSFISIQIQGNKFDDADRMFISILKTFECVCTLKDDVRELIPEFYTFPEILLNKNNLYLSQGKEDKNRKVMNINDVILPPWAENNAGIFVSKMRSFMENNCENINKWIDLIFGLNQRGENAELNNNLFVAQSYEKMIKIEEVTDPNTYESLMRLNEIGVTPFKLYFNGSKKRIDKNEFIKNSPIYSCSKGNFLDNIKKFDILAFNSELFKKLDENRNLSKNKNDNDLSIYILSIKPINNLAKNSLFVLTSSNHWFEIKYNIINNSSNTEEKQVHTIKNNSSRYSASYIMSNLKNIPFVIYGNCKYIIKGGFWDGRLELNSININQNSNNISKCIFSEYRKPIVVIKMSSDEKYLFCGAKSGLISIYKVKGLNLKLKKYIFTHSDEIIDIYVNSNLNMFACSTKDGYIFLYILPTFKLVRAIKIFSDINKCKNTENISNNENDNSINIVDEKNTEKIKDVENKENSDKINEIKIENNNKETNKSQGNDININLLKNENTFINVDQDLEEEEGETEEIYADKIFLSSSPLPCITVYISKNKIFRTYTINGEFVSQQKEEDELGSIYIKSPKIFQNINFHDFLIYGTDKGYIKIRSFPEMKLVGESLNLTDGIPIEVLEISEDKRFIFVWSKWKVFNIIKDINTSIIQTTDNLSGVGFHI